MQPFLCRKLKLGVRDIFIYLHRRRRGEELGRRYRYIKTRRLITGILLNRSRLVSKVNNSSKSPRHTGEGSLSELWGSVGASVYVSIEE